MTVGPGMNRTPLPVGFWASGINCGVRRYRPDLGILISDRDAVGVGVYTLNSVKAASILHSQAATPSAKIRAIITNSGQANAATGPKGIVDNTKMAETVAKELGCDKSQVLTASTGVIGVAMEVDKIAEATPELVRRASNSAESFALAILTTDLIPKTVTTEVTLSGGTVRLTGICKGSGMIHPKMATMLGYLLTDADVEMGLAQELLTEANDLSFNMISVDGDTSTNDCVFFMANGASGVAVKTEEDIVVFKTALNAMAEILAQSIARDGEGSTKLIEVEVKGAPTLGLARQAARGITISPLIKTAIHGEDPNWGRILARLGADGVPLDCLDKTSLEIQGIKVMEAGAPIPFDREKARQELKSDTIHIAIGFHTGDAHAKAWGCDLSRKYIEINAEYST